MKKPETQIKVARMLRRRMTPAEAKLWRILRSRQFAEFKFRRQHPLGKYVVDFICLEKRLIIELDGGHHSLPSYEQADKEREDWLISQNFTVKRFWNTDVTKNIEGVARVIWELLNK